MSTEALCHLHAMLMERTTLSVTVREQRRPLNNQLERTLISGFLLGMAFAPSSAHDAPRINALPCWQSRINV